ncbi:unnamed protein product [Adineta steineri]|uniref:F-box domain-containing protein n=1 Tax=Adineta steineri TaxID=433720 RepID=A0A814AVZ5_9BILA|nr:unnamed protein product [Adineta steineri]
MKVLSILLLFTNAVACFADTIVYRGTICGWGDPSNLNQVLCKGLNPIDSCPPGFLRQQLEGNVAYCYKNSTTIEKDGAPLGTLCGGLARSIEPNCLLKEFVTCFEDLSNELIYEIFELLDFHHVYQAFYSLNTRFYNLIVNSTVPIDINLSSISKSTFHRYNKDVILPNKHRIHSLHLSNPCLYDDISSPIHILSQFLRLETLSLNNIESKHLEYLLPTLVSLSCLSSLSITSNDIIRNKTSIYYQIVRLPALKYCSLSLKRSNSGEPLLLTANEYSLIEHLIIKHDITTNELYNLLSHVPQLRRLYVSDISSSWRKVIKTSVFILPYLTHISLDLNSIYFNAFEEMMIDIFNQVQVLHISIRFIYNEMYDNANRWEQLILSHMPNLRIFDIQYDNITTDNHNGNQVISNTTSDNFTSSFWIKRQSFFTQQYFQEQNRNRTIFYSTDPYRRKHYTLYNNIYQTTCLNSKETHLKSVQQLKIQNDKETINCKYYFPNATTLTLQNKLSRTYNLISVNLSRVIPLKQLTKLVIESNPISLTKLIELLHCTPHIHTLVLKSMSLYGETHLKSVQNLKIQNDKETINCKYYFPNATTLTLQNKLSRTYNFISVNLSRVIPLKQLTKLVIESNPISLTKLIELLRCTPHIHTLVLKSMSLYGINYNSIQQNQSFQLVSNTNTITNVTCNGECTLEKLQILVALFPRIQHLTIKPHTKNLESCTRFLVEKTNRNTNHLCSLCLLTTAKNWLTRLNTLIASETLLDDYMLKMIDWHLYLWW